MKMILNDAWDTLLKTSSMNHNQPSSLKVKWDKNEVDLRVGLYSDSSPFVAFEVNSIEQDTFKNSYANLLFTSFKVTLTPNFGKVFLEVKLGNAQKKDFFFSFLNDVVSYALVDLSNNLVHSVLSRIIGWEEFFRKNHSSALSPEAAKGLWGELFFLSTTLVAIPDFQGALIDGWQSIVAKDKDFRLSSCSIEIKTSNASSQIAHITSLEQLDPETPQQPLFLINYIVSPNGSVLTSLPELVSMCRAHIVNSSNRLLFDRKLLGQGYIDELSESFSVFRYQLQKVTAYEVISTFPSLTRNGLSPSILKAEYQVNLSDCSNFIINIDEVYNAIHG